MSDTTKFSEFIRNASPEETVLIIRWDSYLTVSNSLRNTVDTARKS